MSSIDLAILGIVIEKPRSAYDIQKDVEYHNFQRWTKISVPSIYKKVLRLKEKGYLNSEYVKSNHLSQKAVYSVTEKGKNYFNILMKKYAASPVQVLFDFNVVISNIYKVDKEEAAVLLETLRENIKNSLKQTKQYAEQYADIPLSGRTIFEQQINVYHALLDWLDGFESKFTEET